MLYLDHNATSPLRPEARTAWLAAQDSFWQNPSSPYRAAARAHAQLEMLRERMAALLGLAGEPERLIFNSGATEGNNQLIDFLNKRHQRNLSERILFASAIEHPSLREAVETLWQGRVQWLPVTPGGVLDLSAAEAAIDSVPNEAVALVSVMSANNETGVLQPWQALAGYCRERGIPFHTDASQWLGRLSGQTLSMCDWITGCAHKCGGPRGAGFLVRARDAQGFRGHVGGGQEHGHRAGTEDIASIAAMVVVFENLAGIVDASFVEERIALKRVFEAAVGQIPGGVKIIGSGEDRLWNTAALILPHTEQHRWIRALEKAGVLVSSGAACAGSGNGKDSHVPGALGIDPAGARRILRFSSSFETTAADWEKAARALQAVAVELSESQGGETSVIKLPQTST